MEDQSSTEQKPQAINQPIHAPEPSPSVESKKPTAKRKLMLIASLLFVGLVAVAAILYFTVYGRTDASALYTEALKHSVSRSQTDEVYGSFDVDAGDSIVSGELIGDVQGENGRMRATMEVDSYSDEVPISMTAEMIIIAEGSKSEQYMRYRSLSSSDVEYRDAVESYYAPVMDSWVAIEDTEDETEDEPMSFEEDGALAGMDALGIFLPLTGLSAEDQDVYLNAIEKYQLYSVDKTIESSRIKGIEARKLRVTVAKDVFKEFESEIAEALSDEAGYRKSDGLFVDQLFGNDDKLIADVYLDTAEPRIVGVEFAVKFDEPIHETTFDTTLETVKVSMLVQYDRSLTIEAPAKTITEDEMSALLGE